VWIGTGCHQDDDLGVLARDGTHKIANHPCCAHNEWLRAFRARITGGGRRGLIALAAARSGDKCEQDGEQTSEQN
jgi:hypothetical protein